MSKEDNYIEEDNDIEQAPQNNEVSNEVSVGATAIPQEKQKVSTAIKQQYFNYDNKHKIAKDSYFSDLITPPRNLSESDYYPDQSAVTKGEAFGMPIVAPSALFPFAVMDKELEDKARKRQLENIKYLQSMQFDYAQTLDALRNEKLIKEQVNFFDNDRKNFINEAKKQGLSEKDASITYVNSPRYKQAVMLYHNMAKDFDETMNAANHVLSEYNKGLKGEWFNEEQKKASENWLKMLDTPTGSLENLQQTTAAKNKFMGLYSLGEAADEMAGVLNKNMRNDIVPLVEVGTSEEKVVASMETQGMLNFKKNSPFYNQVKDEYTHVYRGNPNAPKFEEYLSATKDKLYQQVKDTIHLLKTNAYQYTKLKKEIGGIGYQTQVTQRTTKEGDIYVHGKATFSKPISTLTYGYSLQNLETGEDISSSAQTKHLITDVEIQEDPKTHIFSPVVILASPKTKYVQTYDENGEKKYNKNGTPKMIAEGYETDDEGKMKIDENSAPIVGNLSDFKSQIDATYGVGTTDNIIKNLGYGKYLKKSKTYGARRHYQQENQQPTQQENQQLKYTTAPIKTVKKLQ